MVELPGELAELVPREERGDSHVHLDIYMTTPGSVQWHVPIVNEAVSAILHLQLCPMCKPVVNGTGYQPL